MPVRFVVAAIALLALIGVGCGGSSSSTSPQTADVEGEQPLGKEDFIAKADALCAATRERRQAVTDEVAELGGPDATSDDVKRLAELFQQTSQEGREELAQIRSLIPPEADQAAVEEMLSTVDAQVTLTVSYAQALEDGNPSAAKSLVGRINSLAERARGMARAYGFEVCGVEG